MNARTGETTGVSKTGLAWAAVAAFMACAACCALPMIVVLGGGTAASLVAWLAPGMELVAGTVAAVITLGYFAWRARARARTAACSDTCRADASCCSPAYAVEDPMSQGTKAMCSAKESESKVEIMTAVEGAPIVCSLSDADMPQRARDFAAAFENLVGAERFADGCRWTFRNEPGLGVTLRALAKREHECCQFVTFTITDTGEHIVWDTRGPASVQGVIDVFHRLPETLGGDLEALKKQAQDAGLTLVGEARAEPSSS